MFLIPGPYPADHDPGYHHPCRSVELRVKSCMMLNFFTISLPRKMAMGVNTTPRIARIQRTISMISPFSLSAILRTNDVS